MRAELERRTNALGGDPENSIVKTTSLKRRYKLESKVNRTLRKSTYHRYRERKENKGRRKKCEDNIKELAAMGLSKSQ
ncbi:hypothetical protein CHS0354_021969 [Potamilus streckersoni]|uniref:Uncharacterized protein n=1 Tax=Potamilus streckersoni TaxID=2493646 RepID=A0AAE0SKU3_9BIVA|nr:hypothetical protein CHS0354_021969 [Potamilus streckersoni]